MSAPSRRPFEGRIGRTFATSEPWWPPRQRPPDGAPNVVVILVDDMGFGDVGCFGSEIETPAIDALAATGTRYTNFHATPLCAPTRASLLTGLNHHKAGYGTVTSVDAGFPHRSGTFPPGTTTLPEVLRENGYATLAVGKWHLVPSVEAHAGGDRSMWPCSRGFDRWYGFLEGFTNQLHPHQLYRDNSPVQVDEYPDGYYLTDDLTDEALRMVQEVRASDPEKPFFLYFSHAAVHGPLLAPHQEIERFRGRYEEGWDAIRKRRFERQLELGLFPAGTRLPDRNDDVAAWEDLPAEDQALFARMMEVYAAMVASVEKSTARLLALLDDLGERDNTIVLFLSDNGATHEGGSRGMLHYFRDFPRRDESDDEPVTDLAPLGGPTSAIHYPSGWGMVCNTPFRLYKGTLHEGGVRVPLIVADPRDARSGDVDDRWRYVTDLMPTLLELVGLPCPESIDGSSFARPGDASRQGQYDELLGSRSFWEDGWKAVTRHGPRTPIDDSEWELYDLALDPTEIDDRAAEEHERVQQLSEAWESAASANDVFPLDEGVGLGFAIRNPDEERFERPVTLLPGTPTLERGRSARLVHLRSFCVEIDFEWSPGQAGILLAHGDQGCGYAVYVEGDALRLVWNEYGTLHDVEAGAVVAGRQRATLGVTAHPGGVCDVTLGDGRLEAVLMFRILAPFEGIDVGIDRRSPVSWPLYERHGSFPYAGRIHSVTYTPGDLVQDAPQLHVEQMRQAGMRFQ